MLTPRSLSRLQKVAATFVRYGFEDVLSSFDLLSWIGLRPRRKRKPAERQQSRARKLRLALEELGTSYIKLGQLLSTRPDLLPHAYVEELGRLQDRVAPVSFEGMKEVLESELGAPIDETFERFDEEPIASASIAQVYRARLREFRSGVEGDVAVKVVKPGVPELVSVDLEILREVAERLSRSALARRYDFQGLNSQLETTLRAELNLRQEATNAERLRASLREFTKLRVPRIVDELARERVLVLEYVEGARLSDSFAPHPQIADELWRAYLKQILLDGAFQCDPHPGNFLLDETGLLTVLDFGMIAYISRENQLRLMGLLLALVDRDGDSAARLCLEMGVTGRDFVEPHFRAAVSHLVARYVGVRLKDLPFGIIMRDILLLSTRHDVQIPPEMVLLGKTLLNLEPLCRKLDPDMDPVKTMKSFSMRLFEEQIRRDLSWERLTALILELRSFAYEVPLSTRRLVSQMANNELRVGISIEKAEEMQVAIRDVANRISLGVITAALILGSAFLLSIDAGPVVFGYPVFALLGFLLAAGLGIYVVAQILTGRH
ncbi:MAG TPA: AarF/UbiB family protein [Vicinamibacteria bacterium]|nr:AarF/UbiB family protein [Vicinamibacteria bacterium]